MGWVVENGGVRWLRSFTPHAYNAIVQVRQKVPHRRRGEKVDMDMRNYLVKIKSIGKHESC